MASIFNSLKKLAALLIVTIVLAAGTIAFFELFVAGPINMPDFFDQLADITILFFFTAITLFLLQRAKSLIAHFIGIQAATVLQFLSIALTILVVVFIILGIYEVPISTLLTSAGIISITVGLIISTFVGGILSGALVFTTHQLKIGEDVMINNMPGKIVDMTALVIRIRTDMGQITVPNSAVASGGVIITAILKPEITQETRLPYVVGDRVITSYRNEEGTIKELTAFHTTVQLDSGKEITFLNNTVLTGATAIAKVSQKESPD